MFEQPRQLVSCYDEEDAEFVISAPSQKQNAVDAGINRESSCRQWKVLQSRICRFVGHLAMLLSPPSYPAAY